MKKVDDEKIDYKKAIARIYKGNSVIGAGFWVEGGYLITCAHVVRDALGAERVAQPVGQVIKIDFVFFPLDETLSAKVLFYQLDKDKHEKVDIAVLLLLDPVPTGVYPVKLLDRHQLHQPYGVLGFPKGHSTGIASFGQLLVDLPSGWVQLEDTKTQGMAILPGFSGAPVWSEADRAVVGMVVAREREQPEAKIGFMIPARSLQKILPKLKAPSLLELLHDYEESCRGLINRAYQLCTKGWPEPRPANLAGQLDSLQDIPLGDQPYEAIDQFAALFTLPEFNPEPALQKRFEQWLSLKMKADPQEMKADLQALRNHVQSYLADDTQRATATESHLLIHVENGSENARSVKALFIADKGCYRSVEAAGCDPVRAPEAFSEKATLETLPDLVRACLAEVTELYPLQALMIHLSLPVEWLNQDCDRWFSTEQQSTFSAKVPMGADYPFVVRMAERSYPNAIPPQYRHRQKWETKWEELHKLRPDQVCAAFVLGDDLSTPEQYFAKLNQSQHYLGLKLSAVPSELESCQIFKMLIITGTPAAVWLRQEQFAANLVSMDEIDRLLNCNIATLPEAVRQYRCNAVGHIAGPHIGHHLSFLWEDPDLVPPSAHDKPTSLRMPQAPKP